MSKTTIHKFTLHRARTLREHARMVALQERVFAKEFEGFLPTRGHPDWRLKNCWYATARGEMVGTAVMLPLALRVENVSFRAAGLADIVTHPDRRGCGVATRLIGCIEAEARREHRDLMLLFAGPCDFYRRLGYEVVPRPKFILPTACPDFIIPARYQVEEAPLIESLDVLRDIAASSAGEYAGERARTAHYWKVKFKRFTTRNPLLFLSIDRSGLPVAYAIARRHEYGKELLVVESRYRPDHPESPKNLLRAVLEKARALDARQVGAILPETHAFGIKILLLGGRKEINDSLMPRVLDTKRFSANVGELLQSRARLLDGPVRLDAEIASRVGRWKFHFAHGSTSRKVNINLKLEENTFLRLVLGAQSGAQAARHLPAAHRNILDELFPRRNWIYWRMDDF